MNLVLIFAQDERKRPVCPQVPQVPRFRPPGSPGSEERAARHRREFDAFVSKELPTVNKSLSQKKLEPIQLIDRKAWDAADSDSGAGSPGGSRSIREWDRH